MNRPTISVCIATYNGEAFIAEQIQSILMQIEAQDEIIVSDDASTDSTVSIINSIADKRIKVLTDKKFSNPIFNFEHAVKNASKDIIFLSDQDDVWLPSKVSKCLSLLEQYEIVVSDAIIVDEKQNVIHESYFKVNKSASGFTNNLWSNSYLGCCIAFRKDFLPLILPFPSKIPMHDIWIGFVAEIAAKRKFEETPLVLYRRHGGNTSTASEKSNTSFFTKIQYRVNLVRYMPLVIMRMIKRSL